MSDRPNLLFLYTDEQRFDSLACYGNTAIDMPNLNRLAERSTVFEQAYVTQPVCTPSRSSLLTGQYPHTNGCVRNNIPLRDETRCLPEMLDKDYACAHHGKWHLGDEIFAQHGFTEWMGTEDTYHNWYKPERDQACRSNYDRFLRAQGVEPWDVELAPGVPDFIKDRFFRSQIHRMPEELSRPGFLANTASRFIRDHQEDDWVLYVNFLEPHMPFFSCRDDQYDPADVTLSDNLGIAPAEDHMLRSRLAAAGYRAEGYDIDTPLGSEEEWRRLTARYWGMCSLVDSAIGRILATLEQSGQLDNTIIVFTSDHGDMMGSHNLLAKGFMYEESTRVPWLVKLPGQREQRRVRGPVSQVDMVPTLLDAMGQQVPADVQGTSRLELAERGGEATDDVFIEWLNDKQRQDPVPPLPDYAAQMGSPEAVEASRTQDIRTVVCTDGWKYNHSSVGEHELFDLRNDPGEMVNRVADPANAERVAACREKIRVWQATTGEDRIAV
ncbi:MAG: sulfatase [Planctomycetota bacterium]